MQFSGLMRWVAGCTVALLFACVCFPLLDDFGVGWDFGQVGYGDRYVHAIVHLSTGALDFEQPIPLRFPAPHPDLFRHCTEGPELVWPLGPELSVLTAKLFFEWWPVLPPIAARHAASMIVTALLLGFLVVVFVPRLGWFATLFGVVLAATAPAHFWHSLANFKDPPASALVVAAVILSVGAIEHGAARRFLAAGVVFGIALAAKGNAWLVPVIVVLAIVARDGPFALWRLLRDHRRLGWLMVAALVVAPTITWLAWPWLWVDGTAHLREHIEAVLRNRTGSGEAFGGLRYAWATTPETILLGALCSLPLCMRRSARDLRLLWVMVLLPLAQASLPGAKHYDSVRRYLEFLPPLALAAGTGYAALAGWMAGSIGRWLGRSAQASCGPGSMLRDDAGSQDRSGLGVDRGIRRSRGSIVIATTMGVAVLAISIVPLAQLHPDQHLYYNAICGGLPGARERELSSALDFWGHSERRVFEWLAEHAEPESIIHTPTGPQVAQLSNELWGRADLLLCGEKPWRIPLEQGRTVYVAFVERPEYYNDVARYALVRWQPCFEVWAQGVSIAKVYDVPTGSARREELRDLIEFARRNCAQRIEAFRELARGGIGQQGFKEKVLAWATENLRLYGFDTAVRDLESWQEESPAQRGELEVVRRYLIDKKRYFVEP